MIYYGNYTSKHDRTSLLVCLVSIAWEISIFNGYLPSFLVKIAVDSVKRIMKTVDKMNVCFTGESSHAIKNKCFEWNFQGALYQPARIIIV